MSNLNHRLRRLERRIAATVAPQTTPTDDAWVRERAAAELTEWRLGVFQRIGGDPRDPELLDEIRARRGHVDSAGLARWRSEMDAILGALLGRMPTATPGPPR